MLWNNVSFVSFKLETLQEQMGCEAAAVFPNSVRNNMLVVVILCTFYLVCPSMNMASTDMVLVCMQHLLNKVCQKENMCVQSLTCLLHN